MMLDNSMHENATVPPFTSGEMEAHICEATYLLKSLGHEGRLMILCHLSSGEKSVTQLINMLSLPQATISQNLARLRAERLISVRKEGRTRLYSLKDPRASLMVEFIYHLFCSDEAKAA